MALPSLGTFSYIPGQGSHFVFIDGLIIDFLNCNVIVRSYLNKQQTKQKKKQQHTKSSFTCMVNLDQHKGEPSQLSPRSLHFFSQTPTLGDLGRKAILSASVPFTGSHAQAWFHETCTLMTAFPNLVPSWWVRLQPPSASGSMYQAGGGCFTNICCEQMFANICLVHSHY